MEKTTDAHRFQTAIAQHLYDAFSRTEVDCWPDAFEKMITSRDSEIREHIERAFGYPLHRSDAIGDIERYMDDVVMSCYEVVTWDGQPHHVEMLNQSFDYLKEALEGVVDILTEHRAITIDDRNVLLDSLFELIQQKIINKNNRLSHIYSM